jgi:protoporphyrinogen oxidase|tara:strand:+ start:83 stop:1507 length:1425 start_codon:yes stop_codon:yes gene_type:complete
LIVKNNLKKITIIGAGVGGLYAALKFCEKGYSVNLLERNHMVGGLSANIPINGYNIDIGPHYMTLKRESKITDEIFGMIGKNNIIEIKNIEKSYLSYYNHKILNSFPTITDAIFSSGLKSLTYSVISIMKKNRTPLNDNHTSAKNYLKACFGDYLYQLWCEPYLEQNFGTTDLPLEYVKNRFKPITIKKIIKKFLDKKKNSNEVKIKKTPDKYIDCYFRNGIGSLVKILEKQIIEKKGNIILNANITCINHKNKIINYKIGNEEFILKTDKIIYATSPKITSKLFQNVKKNETNIKKTHLNSIMVCFFINSKKLFNGWIVSVFDTKIPFFRLSQQNFLSENISPKNKTLLTAEIRLDENNELWSKNDDEIRVLVEDNLKKMGILKNDEIDGFKLFRFPNLYPKFTSEQKNSNFEGNEILKNAENEYFLGGTQIDTGRFVNAESKINDDHVPSTGGIYNAISNGKKLVENILKSD